MKEKQFLDALASIVLNAIDRCNNNHLRRQVTSIGHFNYRVFKPTMMFRQKASGLIRFLTNLAMSMNEEGFRQMMEEMTDRIVKAVETGECDTINKEHHRK